MTRAAVRKAFTLIEILISILILALGMLGLGILFPVIIREQRQGSDATTGNAVANNARAMLTAPAWGNALPPAAGTTPHPALGSTTWLWSVLRNNQRYAQQANQQYPIRDGLGAGYNPTSPTSFQYYGQGEWFVALVNNDPNSTSDPVGTAAIGFPNDYVRPLPATGTFPKPGFARPLPSTADYKVVSHIKVPISRRLYPLDANVAPQFVWDFAVQRKSNFIFKYTTGDIPDPPDADDLRAVIFVRRIDPRIHFSAASLMDVLPEAVPTPALADQRVPVGEDINGLATLDGTNGDPGNPGVRYSTIKTCEVEFFYQPSNPALNHPDRLYVPLVFAGQNPPSTQQLSILWSQMKQPGQKLVDNLGNVYTVVGSGNEPAINAQNFDGIAGGDYLRVDPPVPVGEFQASPRVTDVGGRYPRNGNTVQRAIWQVCFTPQIPVSVTLVDVLKGSGQ